MFRPTRRTTALVSTLAAAASALAFASPADAGGWTQVASAHHGYVYVCKTAVSSPYGALWKVNVFMSNYYSDHAHTGGVTVYRSQAGTDPVVHRWNRTLAAGATSSVGTVYLSRILPDYLVAGAGETDGRGSGGQVPMSTVTYC